MNSDIKKSPSNFIKNIIDADLKNKKITKIITRFPPEPNGYLHIGHAKSICLNFGLAIEYAGQCNLRFDDTNPANEDGEFAKSIIEDVKWLGFDWGSNLYHASDYYDKFYECAVKLINDGLAYVCDLNQEEVRKSRGTLTSAGTESPYRNRSVDENLNLFAKMRAGEFAEGSKTLRAKIDMKSGNINMRDPAIYRIKKIPHERTGDKWCIYPMYDYAHCISDALEGITHSLCTLEFEDHRPLYDWFLEKIGYEKIGKNSFPQQIEFSRLNLNYTITSKRKLKYLVEKNYLSGWDDPRAPTIAGHRRRGYTPASIRSFCESVGISKQDSVIDVSILEESLRSDLNDNAHRAMAVIDPIKVTIVNYPEDKVEKLELDNHPKKELGKRVVPFTRNIFIERSDFLENAPKDFFRLSLNKEVRLRGSYIIKCEEIIKDSSGNIIELKCSHDSSTLGKNPSDGRKVKGVIHWVSADNCARATIRLYDRLFKVEDPASYDEEQFKDCLNPDSLKVIENCPIELSLKNSQKDVRYQFERLGYFWQDPKDSTSDKLVFSRIVTLKDGWKK